MSNKVIRGAIRHRAILSASVIALAAIPTSALAVSPNPPCTYDDKGICTIEVNEPIFSIYAEEPIRIINNDVIASAIHRGSADYFYVENKAGGTINGILANAPGIYNSSLAGTTIVNAGTINGDVVLDDFGAATYFVDAGGTVTGQVRVASPNSTGSLIYVKRSNAYDPTNVDAGSGIDFYIRSFDQPTEVNLDVPLPTSFEVIGVEARGVQTVVRATAFDPQSPPNGLALLGNGHIVTSGTIAPIASEFGGAPAVYYLGQPGDVIDRDNYGLSTQSALSSFTNQGTISGDIILATAWFTNNGDIRSTNDRTSGMVAIRTAVDQSFVFQNSGDIALDVDTSGTSAVYVPGAVRIDDYALTRGDRDFSIQNSGTIAGGITANALARTLTFTNEGTISRPSGENVYGPEAVHVTLGSSQGNSQYANADTATIINRGDILGGASFDISANRTNFLNTGKIHAAVSNDQAIELEIYDAEEEGGNFASLNFTNEGEIVGAVSIDSATIDSNIINSGTISAKAAPWGPYSNSAFYFEGEATSDSVVRFTNAGVITSNLAGGNAVMIEVDGYDDDLAEPRATFAGPKQDIVITNSGTISATGGTLDTTFYDQSLNLPSVALVAMLDSEGADSIRIINAEGGVISGQATATEANPNPTGHGLGIVAGADNVTIVNAGLIAGANQLSNDQVVSSFGDNLEIAETQFGGAIDTFASTDIVRNEETGQILGGISLREGDDCPSSEHLAQLAA